MSRSLRVLAAPTAYKGTLSNVDAARAIAAGARDAGEVQVRELALSDGGDGLLECVAHAYPACVEWRTTPTVNALGEPIEAPWLIARNLPMDLGLKSFALIEAARVIGLAQIPADRRDPMRATSRGLAPLVRAASAAGCTICSVGLGGTATVDGGIGLLGALGWRLFDRTGRELPAEPSSLPIVADLVHEPFDSELIVQAMCDVAVPIAGPSGAARVFGPQKGAGPREVEWLDAALAHWAPLCLDWTREELREEALSSWGAAGGLPLAVHLVSGWLPTWGMAGVDARPWTVFQLLDFALEVMVSDLVITGEGQLDEQTRLGKVVAGVARQVRPYADTTACVAICGSVRGEPERLRFELGLDEVVSLAELAGSTEAATAAPSRWLREGARQVVARHLERPPRGPGARQT